MATIEEWIETAEARRYLCQRQERELGIIRARVAELEAKAEGDLNFVKSMNDEADQYREALEKIQKAEEASPTVTLLDFGEGLIALEDFLEDVLDPK
jgi:hypothetical protein